MHRLLKLISNKKLYYSLYLLHFTIVLIAWWVTSGSAIPQSSVGYAITRFGALLGLIGGSFLLFQFLLISRAPWLEHVFGHDNLTRMHRVNGLIGFTLILFHPVLIVFGSSVTTNSSFVEQAVVTTARPNVLLAVIGFFLLIGVVVISLIIIRSRLKYETWFFVHLLNYVFLALVVWHQFSVGAELQNGQWLRWYWLGLYVFVVFHILYFRFLRPIMISYKNSLTVDRIVTKGSITSIYIGGNIKNLNWKGGQFAYWRFLTKQHGKEQHPFSISVEPNNKHLRISAKAVGDYTNKMSDIPVGSKLIMDGPHGIFTLDKAIKNKFLFIAGGIGITPIRSILGELESTNDVVLLYSASKEDDLVFKNELARIIDTKNFTAHYFVTGEDSKYHSDRISINTLKEKAPDFTEREIYICGPLEMIDTLRQQLHESGVSESQVHFELFSLV